MDAKFTYTQSGYSDYIIVEAARADNESDIVGTPQVFGTPPPATVNIVYPGLDPGVHKFFFYDSPDGVIRGLLIAVFTFDVESNIVLTERRFYVCGGGGASDPAPGDSFISDSYLDGKTISGVFKEGFRFLQEGAEWTLYGGGGISLLNGLDFALSEVVSIEITYLTNQVVQGGSSGAFAGLMTITDNTTLDASYLGKRIRCEGSGSRLVVTFDFLANVATGKPMYFTAQTGNQIQTKFITQGGDLIAFNGQLLSEIVIGKGEILWIEKAGAVYEVINDLWGAIHVGERFASRTLNVNNTLPEDGQVIYNGDDYPRYYYWLKNSLPAAHKVTILDAAMNTYVPTPGREALPVMCSDSKRFRTGDMRGLAEKALDNFVVYNTDVERVYDYPGGIEDEEIGQHSHDGIYVEPGSHGGASSALSGGFKPLVNVPATGATNGYFVNSRTGNVTPATTLNRQNKVKNAGFIFLTRI